jgi:dipeptidase D
MEIHLGLGNANKMMNRVLFAVNDICSVSSLLGGSLRNAIPRESTATVVVNKDKVDEFHARLENTRLEILEEYKLLDPDLEIISEKLDTVPETGMNNEDQDAFIKAVFGTHNGVYRMSPAISDLVESSNNLAKITLNDGTITIECLTRSSVESSKMDMAYTLQSVFELAGFKVSLTGGYPGWAPNMDSALLKVMDALYETINGKKANVAACHAGLECGILGTNYPGMDMISFGPTIKGAHSPDERASISSTQKFWIFVLEILKNIPVK